MCPRLTLVALACALTSLPSACAPAALPRTADRRVLDGPQLWATDAPTTREAVMRLRPEFLLPSSVTLNGTRIPPVVYIDDVRAGGVDVLDAVPLRVIREIRFLRATDAAIQLGAAVGVPTILVRTSAAHPR